MTLEATSENPTILVADDEADILALIAFRLEQSGYTVVTASDGEQAVAKALEVIPDLAILDVMMPKLDGYNVTKRLREHAATSRIPIILLTARVQEADVERGFEVGADDYIKKPFSPRELQARVESMLGRR